MMFGTVIGVRRWWSLLWLLTGGCLCSQELRAASPSALQPADATTYLGSGVSFHAALEGETPFGYQWYFNGSPLTGATQAVLAIDSVNVEDEGNYQVTASNHRGSVTSRVARLTVPLPANDQFEGRTKLGGSRAFATGFNRGASRQAEEPGDDSGVSGRSVWWSWVAPATGTTVISTWQSSFRTVLGLYTGEKLSSLSSIATSAAPDWQGNSIQFDAIEGTTYQISVDGQPGEVGTIALAVEQSVDLVSVPVLDWARFKPGRLGMAMAAHPSGAVYLADQQWVEKLDPAGNTLWLNPAPGDSELDHVFHIGLDEAGNCFVWSYNYNERNATSTLTRYSARGDLVWTVTRPCPFASSPGSDWFDVNAAGQVSHWSPWASYDFAGRTIYELEHCLTRGGTCDIFPYPGSIHRDAQNRITFLAWIGEFISLSATGELGPSVPAFDANESQPVYIVGNSPDGSSRVVGAYNEGSSSQRSFLRGFDASGTEAWTTRFDAYGLDGGGLLDGGPSGGAVGEDGGGYLGGMGWRDDRERTRVTKVMKFSPNGQLQWRTWCDSELVNSIETDSMRIGRDGSLYFTAEKQVRSPSPGGVQPPLLFKFRPDGQLVFSHPVDLPESMSVGRFIALPTAQDDLVLIGGGMRSGMPGCWITRFTQPLVSGYPQLSEFPQGATVRPKMSHMLSAKATTNSGAVWYQWRKDGVDIPGATLSTLRLPWVTSSNAGVYSVKVGNAVGTTQSPEARLRMMEPLGIIATNRAGSINQGFISTSVKVLGSDPLFYQWFKDGKAIESATNDTFYTLTTPEYFGEYSLRVSNPFESVSTQPGFLIVAPVLIKTSPQSQEVLEGEIATLTLEAGCCANLQWFFQDRPVVGATNYSWKIARTRQKDQGEYWVFLSNRYGMWTSAVARLTVKAAHQSRPPVFLEAPDGLSPKVVLDATAVDDPSERYQWYVNGRIIPGAVGSRLDPRLEDYADAPVWDFTCTIQSASGVITRLVGRIVKKLGLTFSSPEPINPQVGRAVGSSWFQGEGDPVLGDRGSGRAVWFAWTSPADGVFGVSAAGTNVQCLLSVYDGEPDDFLKLLSSNTTFEGFRPFEVRFEAKSNHTYRIAVDGASGDFDPERFGIAVRPVPAPPFREAEGWVDRYDGPLGGHDVVTDLTVDKAGSAFVAGTITDTHGLRNMVVVKYSSEGVRLWVAESGDIESSGDDWVSKVVSDAEGGCFVAGYTKDPLGKKSFTLTRFSQSGQRLWARQQESVSEGNEVPGQIVRDDDGIIMVGVWIDHDTDGFWCRDDGSETGLIQGALRETFNQLMTQGSNSDGEPPLPADLSHYIFTDQDTIAKLDSSGNTLWTWRSLLLDGKGLVKRGREGTVWAAATHASRGKSFSDFLIFRIVDHDVPKAPRIISGPISQSVYDGEAAALDVVATGDAPLSYQWHHNGALMPGEVRPQLVLGGMGKGDYLVTVSNRFGNTTATASVRRSPPPKPPRVGGIEANGGVWTYTSDGKPVYKMVVGRDLEINMDPDGDNPCPGCALQWLLDGRPIPNQTRTELSIDVGPQHAGVYSLILSNSLGSLIADQTIPVMVVESVDWTPKDPNSFWSRSLHELDAFPLGPWPRSSYPFVLAQGTNGVLVVWRFSGSAEPGIRLMRFDSHGALLWETNSRFGGGALVSSELITALTQDHEGNVFVAGVGEEQEYVDVPWNVWIKTNLTLRASEAKGQITLFAPADTELVLDDLSLVATATGEGGHTLLGDGGFEASWGTGPWYALPSYRGSRQVSSPTHGGGRALLLGKPTVVQDLPFALRPGASYRLDFWYHLTGQTTGLRAGLGGSGPIAGVQLVPAERPPPEVIYKTVAVVLKYSADGTQQWKVSLPRVGEPRDLLARANGDLYVVSEAATLKLDSNGRSVWPSARAGGFAITADAAGSLYLVTTNQLLKWDENESLVWARDTAVDGAPVRLAFDAKTNLIRFRHLRGVPIVDKWTPAGDWLWETSVGEPAFELSVTPQGRIWAGSSLLEENGDVLWRPDLDQGTEPPTFLVWPYLDQEYPVEVRSVINSRGEATSLQLPSDSVIARTLIDSQTNLYVLRRSRQSSWRLENYHVGQVVEHKIPLVPSITRHPEDLARCPGGDAQFIAAASSAGTMSYQWGYFDTADERTPPSTAPALFSVRFLPGATNSSLELTNLTIADLFGEDPEGGRNGLGYRHYFVQVSNRWGVVATDNAVFAHADRLDFYNQRLEDQNVVEGDRFELQATAGGFNYWCWYPIPDLRYQWFRRGVEIRGATNDVLVVDPAKLSDAGGYSVSVQGRGPWPSITSPVAQISVTARTSPVASVRIEPPGVGYAQLTSVILDHKGDLVFAAKRPDAQWPSNSIYRVSGSGDSELIAGFPARYAGGTSMASDSAGSIRFVENLGGPMQTVHAASGGNTTSPAELERLSFLGHTAGLVTDEDGNSYRLSASVTLGVHDPIYEEPYRTNWVSISKLSPTGAVLWNRREVVGWFQRWDPYRLIPGDLPQSYGVLLATTNRVVVRAENRVFVLSSEGDLVWQADLGPVPTPISSGVLPYHWFTVSDVGLDTTGSVSVLGTYYDANGIQSLGIVTRALEDGRVLATQAVGASGPGRHDVGCSVVGWGPNDLSTMTLFRLDCNGEKFWEGAFGFLANAVWNPRGLGTDSHGNVYVAFVNPFNRALLSLQKYDLRGSLVWNAIYDGMDLADNVSIYVRGLDDFWVMGNGEPSGAPTALRFQVPPTRAPTILSGPSSISTPVGRNVALSVAAQDLKPIAYQWFFKGKEIPAATNTTLLLPDLTTEADGLYWVEVSNGEQAVISCAARVKALVPATVVATSTIIQATLGQPYVYLSAEASGSRPLFYNWLHDGKLIVPFDQGTPGLVLTNIQASDAGEYSVVVTNAATPFPGVTSRVAMVTVATAPRFAPHSTNYHVALNGQLTLSAEMASPPPYSFQWRRNGENIPGATNSTYTINQAQVSDGGRYTVIVANQAGAVLSDPYSVQVHVPQTPPADLFANRVPILGLTGTLGGTNLHATSEPGEPRHAEKAGGKSVWYTWKAPADGIATFRTIGSTFDTLLAVYTGVRVEQLTPVANDEDRGGFFTSQLQFNVAAGVEYQIAIDGFAGAAGDFILEWVLEVTEESIPVFVQHPQSQIVSLGQTVTLTAVAEGSRLRYQWSRNGQSIPGATGPSLTLPSMRAVDVAQYAVRVENKYDRIAESHVAALEVSVSGSPVSRDKLEDLLESAEPVGLGPRPADLPGGSFVSVSAGSLISHLLVNTNSTTQSGEPLHCGVIGGASQWEGIRAAEDGVMRIDTIGSEIDTLLAVYRRTNLFGLANNLMACDNDSAPDGKRSVVVFDVRKGQEYLIMVDGVKASQGSIQLNWQLGTPPVLAAASPVVQTLRRGKAVTLDASSLTQGQSSNVEYQWSRNGTAVTGATNTTLALSAVESEQDGEYSLQVRNLFGTATAVISKLQVELPTLELTELQVSGQRWLQLTVPGGGPHELRWSVDLVNWFTAGQIGGGSGSSSQIRLPMEEGLARYYQAVPLR